MWLDDTLQQLTILRGVATGTVDTSLKVTYPNPGQILPLRQPAFWKGTAVISSTLVMTVQFTDSLHAPRTKPETLAFTVNPQTLSKYHLQSQPLLNIAVEPGVMTQDPSDNPTIGHFQGR